MKKSILALALLGALSMSTFAGEIGSSRSDSPENQSPCVAGEIGSSYAGEIGSSFAGEIGSSRTCPSQNQSAQSSNESEESSEIFDIFGIRALLGF